jgi:purine-binding chemotaxis protein CheW
MNANERGTAAAAGKYLTFRLASEEYGLEILKVKEIIGIMRVTKIPKTPDYVRGVINLRGAVIPIIELRNKFGLAEISDTAETCVIVVEIIKSGIPIHLGILTDSVSEVIDISEPEIEDTPSFGVQVDTEYILGMAKTKGGIKILLNIEKVLTESEITGIENLKQQVTK